jgi:hypothetical protein
VSWVPIDESGVGYVFDGTDAAITDSVVEYAGEGDGQWWIDFDVGELPRRFRVTALEFAQPPEAVAPVSFSWPFESETVEQVNESGSPADSFEPSPFEGEVDNSGEGSGYIGFFPEFSTAFRFLIEVWVEAPPSPAPPIDRKVLVAVSRDGGHTWSSWRERSLGELGEYRRRVTFSRFGQARQMVLKIRVTSPIRADLFGIAADLEPGE